MWYGVAQWQRYTTTKGMGLRPIPSVRVWALRAHACVVDGSYLYRVHCGLQPLLEWRFAACRPAKASPEVTSLAPHRDPRHACARPVHYNPGCATRDAPKPAHCAGSTRHTPVHHSGAVVIEPLFFDPSIYLLPRLEPPLGVDVTSVTVPKRPPLSIYRQSQMAHNR